jgi:hypothetical protein
MFIVCILPVSASARAAVFSAAIHVLGPDLAEESDDRKLEVVPVIWIADA